LKINIYSLTEARATANKNEYWISIRDKGYESLYEDFSMCPNKTLILTFDDVDPFRVERNIIHPFYKDLFFERRPVYFTEEMAEQVLDFTERILLEQETSKIPKILNIHCYAGMSRSQAIGQSLNTYYNLFMDQNHSDYLYTIHQNNKRSMVNPLVIKIMHDVLYHIKGRK
jgi:predicted protein tyrosine phosphatase